MSISLKKDNQGLSGIKKLGKNMIIFSIGSFASKLMGYFLIPFYTYILTQSEYGIYDIVITTVNLLFPFFTMLITEATMRFALDKEIDKNKIFSISFFVITVSIIISLLISPIIFFSDTYSPYYVYFVIYYIVSTYHTLLSQFVKGIEATTEFAVSGILGTAVTLIFNILLMVFIKMGLHGYFIATFAGYFASIIYLYIKCGIGRYFCKLNKQDKPLLNEMFRYSLPIVPNALSWWVSTSSDKYIIAYFWSVAETGLYSVAYKIPSLMTVFTTIFFNAWQISAVENFGTEKSSALYSKVYRYLFSFLLISSSTIILFSEFIGSFLFLNSFKMAWKYVPMLLVAYVFHDIAAFVGSVYTSSKNTKMLFYSTVFGAVANVIFNMIMIPKWGAMGAAFGTVISYSLICIIRIVDTKKYIDIEYNYVLNGLSLVCLMVEMYIISMEIPYSKIIGLFLVLIIFGINGRSFLEVIKNFINNKIRKHKEKRDNIA